MALPGYQDRQMLNVLRTVPSPVQGTSQSTRSNTSAPPLPPWKPRPGKACARCVVTHSACVKCQV